VFSLLTKLLERDLLFQGSPFTWRCPCEMLPLGFFCSELVF